MDSSLVLVPQPLSSIYTVHPSLLEILSFPGFFVATFSGIFPLPCSFSNPSCWFLISYLNPVCWNTSEVSLEQSFLYLYTLRVCVSQSCPTLCDPMDCSPPHSSIHRILQARILEWVAIPFSRESSQTRDQTWVFCIGRWILWHLSHQGSPVTGFKQQVCVCMLSCFSRAQLFATLWTIALQAPLSMGFSRQEY